MELTVVRRLIDRLNHEKVLYCHWKSNQHVSDAFTGVDDIDMLIDQDDILKLNIILNELGYKRLRLPEKRAYIGIEDYLGFDEETGLFVHLHLHYQLTLGEKFLKGYQLPYSKSILHRRIFDKRNSIYITSHEDEMWLLLLRSTLKLRHRDLIKLAIKKDIFEHSTYLEFEWLKQNISIGSFKEISVELFGAEIANKMTSTIDSGISFGSIFRLNKVLRKRCKPFKSYTLVGGTITRWSREYFRVCQFFNNRISKSAKSYRRTPIAGGKVIAFLGPDGAGKSTIIKEVNMRLESIMDVNRFYLGSGDGHTSLLRQPLKVLYRFFIKRGTLNIKSKKVDEAGRTYRVNENSIAGFIRRAGELPWTLTLARERRKKLFRAKRFRNKGYIVLTDRYPQSQVSGMCDGPHYYLSDSTFKRTILNRLLINIEKSCFEIADIAKPEVVVILKVSSEVAYERKPDEIDIDSHKNLMKAILNLDFGEDTKKIIINADQPLDKVIIDTLAGIWRCL